MDIVPQLIEIVGRENIFDDRVECLSYSRDLSVHEGIPDAVVFAYTTEQVSAIMRLANEKKVPVTVQGSGNRHHRGVSPRGRGHSPGSSPHEQDS